MAATGDLFDRSGRAKKIDTRLLPVCGPRLFDGANLVGRSDSETSERQDHRANAEVMLRALTNLPTFRAPENRVAKVTVGSNLLQHRVQLIA